MGGVTGRAAALVLLLVVAGCTPDAEVTPAPQDPAPTTPATPSAPSSTASAAPTAPLTPAERAARCGDRGPDDVGGPFDFGQQQPRYAGSGPHPTIAAIYLNPADLGEGGATDLTFDTAELPARWAPPKSGDRFDASRAQLVVCMTGARERGDKPVGVCETTHGGFDIYPFRYTLTVYEARTAREVATMTVDSDLRPAERSCPAVIQYDALRGYTIAQDIDRATLKKRLSRYVLRTVR